MLRKLRRHWEQFGREDPFWAALTWKDKSDGRWSADDFFQNGEVVVGNLLDRAAELGIEIPRERALDFGCGPGRLTQALAARFETVDGVDIARSMIANARRFNRHGDRCRYHVNRRAHLRRFGDATFTFVCSLLVLQHMKPGIARGYVREFMRVLAPSGVLVFQVPSYEVDSSEPARQSVPHWPLEPSACRARIRPASDSLAGRAGELVPLRVEVENSGDGTWPCLGQSDGSLRVWLGGHLALPGDEYYWRLDAMRTALGRDLDPGQRVTLETWLTLPEENGDYLLELDMVQEHVCWFRQRGSEAAVVRCRVEGGRERPPGEVPGPRIPRSAHAPAPAAVPEKGTLCTLWLARAWKRSQFLKSRIQSSLASREAVMEMHGLARPDVQNLVTEAGCRLIEVDRQAQEHGYQDCHFWITR